MLCRAPDSLKRGSGFVPVISWPPRHPASRDSFGDSYPFFSVTRLLLDPLVAVGALVAVTLAHGEPFRGKYMVLALIVFSLTFPGRLDLAGGPVTITRDIVLRWIPIVVLLLMFGYAAEYLQAFPGTSWPLGLSRRHARFS